MGTKTAISWTEHTQNFWKGCAMVSPGCKNCYMFRDMRRYGIDPEVVTRTKTWGKPRKWNRDAEAEGRPHLVFTCSWSDFFIEQADPWRDEAWKIIKETPWLQYQVLTKRIGLVKDRLPADWGDGYENVWLGVSIESATYNWRADALREIPARVRFISAEPLLAPLTGLNLDKIHWLIAGGESGPDFREMKEEWALELRDMCRKAGTAFYYKQGSALLPGVDDKLAGEQYHEYPEYFAPEVVGSH